MFSQNSSTKLFISISILASNQFCGIKESSNSSSGGGHKSIIKDPQEVSRDLIYGLDDRQDVYRIDSELHMTLSRSTVALVKKNRLSTMAQGFRLTTTPYAQQFNLCTDEAFYTQPTAAYCSGSLVGPRHILTAGHCVQNQIACASMKVVFDYEMINSTQARTEFSQQQVYNCHSIIKQEFVANGRDYAVIELDRDVVGYEPLPIRRGGQIKLAESVFVIGHPSGLPKKIAGKAQVRTISSEHFTANLDTYGGNSGSPVFNSNSGLIEGVLVRGDTDYIWRGNCRVSNQCSDQGCRGEDVTHIGLAAPFIPEDEREPPSRPILRAVKYASTQQHSIPDDSNNGITSSLMAGEAPESRKILVDIDLIHTWIGDLELILRNPEGTEIFLHKRQHGSKKNISGTYGLSLEPYGNLGELSKTAQAGTWSLAIKDKARFDVGHLRSWSLRFEPY
jgi:subtilisin-like proprotein convertase family protein